MLISSGMIPTLIWRSNELTTKKMCLQALHKSPNHGSSLRLNSNGVRKFHSGLLQPWVQITVTESTPKEFANAFSVECATPKNPQDWKPNPGLKFANAFGV
jgi:hypothetical protein